MNTRTVDVIVIGAGAAGMMCGAVAGATGQKVLIVDHARAVGEKIRISGGGRCNFTNLYCGPENFISGNPHFCKSALAGYSPQDFIGLVDAHGIAWHEKKLGQLFCDGRSTQIVKMLSEACEQAGNDILLDTEIKRVQKDGEWFSIQTSKGDFSAKSLVVACGGPSIPKMGASGYGYQLAEQFGLKIITPQAALVPLTFNGEIKESMRELAGVALPVRVKAGSITFNEDMLFTHRGLSGPAILQISSYLMPGQSITINLAPTKDLPTLLQSGRNQKPKLSPAGLLASILPQRLAQQIAKESSFIRLADMGDAAMQILAKRVHNWEVLPAGSEGFRTAEVTRGGVDTGALSSKSMAVKKVPDLYFIGEVVDVTGHLGGHNFQWAWASGVAAGRVIARR